MIRRIARLARFWWLSVPEPRVLSLLVTFCYLVAIVGGGYTIAATPEIQGDTALSALTGALLVGGSLFGLVCTWRKAWAFERIAIGMILLASVVYLLALLFESDGATSHQVSFIFALTGSLLFGVRFGMILLFSKQPEAVTL